VKSRLQLDVPCKLHGFPEAAPHKMPETPIKMIVYSKCFLSFERRQEPSREKRYIIHLRRMFKSVAKNKTMQNAASAAKSTQMDIWLVPVKTR